ncbi:AMIN-like domain-containing (lipo)protein [Streptomyces sp. BRA346]|uniref:AMIN-like domain-containing (lipo)protein n=1 Tax=Streptomyces sp. BRA346 TaxID=2878199 RepID=UPI0040628214
MRRWGTSLAAIVLAGAGLAVTAGTAEAAQATGAGTAAACATGWGSGEKTAPSGNAKPLENIRTGQHECFDRMVFDVKGATAADHVRFDVRYVDALYQDGSGDPIPVNGGAILDIRVGAPSYDYESGHSTYPGKARQPLPGVNVSGYQTFRDTRYGASFEGDTQIGLGVRARLPFRVFQSDGKVIVDVAHFWTAAR